MSIPPQRRDRLKAVLPELAQRGGVPLALGLSFRYFTELVPHGPLRVLVAIAVLSVSFGYGWAIIVIPLRSDTRQVNGKEKRG